jgi:hypothetical protein
VLRRDPHPTITVYDWRADRRKWTVRLPARRRWSADERDLRRQIEWDFATDGTIAVALATSPPDASRVRAELGWIRPHGTFRPVTAAVLLQDPFVVTGNQVTYARPAADGGFQVYSRGFSGQPVERTRRLRRYARVAVSADLIVVEPVSKIPCLLAAPLSLASSERWTCPATTSQ